jgi:helix-turn-helix protein
VRRFIRDGRLPAKRIGKEYRITRSALDEFAGTPATEPSDAAIPRTRQVLVSSIVDVDAISCPMMYRPRRRLRARVHAMDAEIHRWTTHVGGTVA